MSFSASCVHAPARPTQVAAIAPFRRCPSCSAPCSDFYCEVCLWKPTFGDETVVALHEGSIGGVVTAVRWECVGDCAVPCGRSFAWVLAPLTSGHELGVWNFHNFDTQNGASRAVARARTADARLATATPDGLVVAAMGGFGHLAEGGRACRPPGPQDVAGRVSGAPQTCGRFALAQRMVPEVHEWGVSKGQRCRQRMRLGRGQRRLGGRRWDEPI